MEGEAYTWSLDWCQGVPQVSLSERGEFEEKGIGQQILPPNWEYMHLWNGA